MRLQPVNLFGTKKQSGIGNIWFSVPEFISLADVTPSAGFTISGENLPLNGTVLVSCTSGLEITDYLASYPPVYSSTLSLPYSGTNLVTAAQTGSKAFQVRLKPNKHHNYYNEFVTCTVGNVTAQLNCTGRTTFDFSNAALHYDVSNPDSYTGTQLKNLVNYQHFTLNNTVSYDSSNYGSLAFSGFSNTPSVGYSDGLNDFSFSVWFKSTTNTLYQRLIAFGYLNNPAAGSLDTTLNNGGFPMFVWWNGSGAKASYFTGGTLSDSTWHQYAFTRSVSNSPYTEHYVDGVLIGTTTRTGSQTENIGFMPGTLQMGSLLTGNISIIKLFKRVLTSTEIAYEYNMYKNRYI